MSNALIKRESTQQRIWDLPIRLWHWILTGSLIAASVISLAFGEHSSLFPYHSMLGLVMGLMVVLRIFWGVIGTRHARFASLAFGPGALLSYLRGAAFGGAPRFAGHNPGAAYATIAMLILILVICGTGIALSQGNEGIKELHEISVYALLAVAGAHILGVIAHTVRHHEPIALSMIHGKKIAEPDQAITSSRPVPALVFLLLVGGWAFMLARDYDPATQSTSIPFTSFKLQLGEAEGQEEGEGNHGEAAQQSGERGSSGQNSHEDREDDDD
ncbi:MAG: cytochrome b/b6 domain-containing protein [Phycisphaerales bacterium]|nr:cytochrome b/b6 domain-containing protein [Phycisphaerales bacterium]